ncbi:Mitochondrial branched-chain amino acid (BCAA) aminotransferase [Sarracenia purpurea var. burkii]
MLFLPNFWGLYYWSANIAAPRWAPNHWLWAVTTSVDFSLAQLIQVIILLSTGGKNGGGYEASKYVVIGLHGGILFIHAIINSLPIIWLSFFGQLAAAWNLVGVFVLMILIPVVAKERASAKFVFTSFNTDNGDGISSPVYIFFLGLLTSQYTLTGYDASAHMTEETKSAAKNGPKGIISAIGISVIVGWGYLLGITFAVTDIPYLLSDDNDAGGYAIAEIYYLAFKSRYGNGFGGLFAWEWLVLPYFSASLGSLVAFQAMVSIATIGLYIAYALPIFLRVTLASKSFIPGPFNLGRYGILVGWIAVLWVAAISVIFSLPVAYPVTEQTLNYTPVAVGGLLILTVSYWILSARHWFKGPVTNIDN